MTKPKGKPKIGRTYQEFRETHDKDYIVPNRIRDALKALGDSWMYEAEFAKHAGLSQTDLSTYREEFLEDHTIVVDRTRRIWCGTKRFKGKLSGLTP